MRRVAVTAVLIALAGCSQKSDEEKVVETIRDFAKATTEADGETLCKELYTREFLELATGATGDKAVDQCVDQTEQTRGNPIEIMKLGKIEIDGDKASVNVVVKTRAGVQEQPLELHKEDGDFRLAAN